MTDLLSLVYSENKVDQKLYNILRFFCLEKDQYGLLFIEYKYIIVDLPPAIATWTAADNRKLSPEYSPASCAAHLNPL